ncbi:DUF6087 family protein [Streptomyces sp. NBC_00536]|uniref:DUF6087 family protein n=1 Tax=Streptomyces sp. NBC_00536 TaxID=2975769 RepID=UPI002E7FE037|nr:DUF6087 family protein [Streptomyces sp. NBC_00536]WUC83037.1 DUF6087 family protein [Streptomyces sp. NBC_00536]
MGRHRRPGPPVGPAPTVATWPEADPSSPLAAYERRRTPPMGVVRRHRPASGGGSHVRPDEPRVLEEWDGFRYAPLGTAPNLATARAWEAGSPWA